MIPATLLCALVVAAPAMAERVGSVMAEVGPVMAEVGPVMAEVGPVMTETGPAVSAEPQSKGEEEILTLERAVAIALENNRDLKSAVLESEKAEDGVSAARTRLLPVTDISATGSKLLSRIEYDFPKGAFGDLPGVGPVPAEDTTFRSPNRFSGLFSATVTQPLTQLYKAGLNVQIQRAGLEKSHEALRGARQSVSNSVKRLYHAILESQSALDASEEALSLYTEVERVVTGYVAQETALRVDALEVLARLAAEKQHALSLRNTLTTRKEQLNDLMGRDISFAFRTSELSEPTPLETDLEAGRTRALSQRPEVREAGLALQQAELDRRTKRSELIPDLSVGYSYLSPYNVDILPRNISSVRVQFSWDPIDWGRRRRELSEKTRTIEQASVALENARSRVRLEVGAAFRQLEESRMLVETTRLASEAARERSRVEMSRYEQEASLLKDVLQAQSDLADANHTHQQAVLGFWTARADFQKAIGEE